MTLEELDKWVREVILEKKANPEFTCVDCGYPVTFYEGNIWPCYSSPCRRCGSTKDKKLGYNYEEL